MKTTNTHVDKCIKCGKTLRTAKRIKICDNCKDNGKKMITMGTSTIIAIAGLVLAKKRI